LPRQLKRHLYRFLFLLCIAHAWPVNAAENCDARSFAKFAKAGGFHFPYQNPADSLSEYNPSVHLGGYKGGQVFLVRISPSESRVAKVYYQERRFRHDRALLENWRNKSAHLGRDLGFQIVRIERAIPSSISLRNPDGAPVLSLAFVRGRTVHDLLLDTNLSSEFRDRILLAYTERLNRFQAEMTRIGAKSLTQLPPSPGIYPDQTVDQAPQLRGSLAGMDFIIKSDNIVVDPITMQMTIVDPH
jgi:hypothetical protein